MGVRTGIAMGFLCLLWAVPARAGQVIGSGGSLGVRPTVRTGPTVPGGDVNDNDPRGKSNTDIRLWRGVPPPADLLRVGRGVTDPARGDGVLAGAPTLQVPACAPVASRPPQWHHGQAVRRIL